MKIGIIGAGMAGLTAGRILARAGHEIIVFEKSKGFGGRMSTRRPKISPRQIMDHGAPFISGTTKEFQDFINELEENNVIKKWTDTFSSYRDGQIVSEIPGSDGKQYYIAPEGMNSIGKFLGRWLDFQMNEKVGALTYIGGSRIKKSPWMINSSTINVFESDAVIIATPAIQAYGLLSTAQDERELRRMITVLDDISYSSTYSFMAGYGERQPFGYKAVKCDHPVLGWICNESSKRETSGKINIVAHTTDSYTKKAFGEKETEEINDDIMAALGEILGSWAGRPEWHESHLWRYRSPKNSLDMPFLESEDEEAPLALAGDYFQGHSMETAYLSGLRLGKHWAEKLS